MKKAGHRPYKLYLGFKMDGSALKSQSANDLGYGTILSIISWRIYDSVY